MTALDVLIVIGVIALCLATLAGTGLVLLALWRGLAGQWRHLPAQRRRTALVTALPLAALMITGTALEILAPWGPHSDLYVIGVGAGAGLVIGTAATAAIGVCEVRREIRRTRLRGKRPRPLAHSRSR